MGAWSYEDLRRHVGHEIVCVNYVGRNVAVECITCSEVLLDYDEYPSDYEDDGQPDEQQENEDFARDGDFDNMEPNDDGTWS